MTPDEIKRLAYDALSVSSEIVGCSFELACGRSQKHSAARARHVAMLALKKRGLSSTKIGAAFGRDHTTVVYGLAKARWSGGIGEALERDADKVITSITQQATLEEGTNQ